VLASRGFCTSAAASAYLDASNEPDTDLYQLPDLDRAVRRLLTAIRNEEKIVVYGDFDVDGVSAAAILLGGLAELGANVRAFIPNRFVDGYGLNSRRLAQLHSEGAQVAVTVDCGVTAVAEISEAVALGLSVIVLDHHEPGSELPPAVAVVDPKRPESSYPARDLCSGVLAFYLLRALYAASGRSLDENRYLDVAALATVCDLVPLQGENRAIVRAGLRALTKTTRPGLRALLRSAGVTEDDLDAATLGYVLGPRLNAAGRIDDASLALELLTTCDEVRAEELSEQLNLLNRRRQAMVEEAQALAISLVSNGPADVPAIVVGDAGISRGIVGLIASRLAEVYRRPAFVYEESADLCVGSARGVPGFDVVSALREARTLLVRHGGHVAAGGFALEQRNLPAFRETVCAAAEKQLANFVSPAALEIDAEARLAELNRQTLGYLSRFSPCGAGNPPPLFLTRGVRVTSGRSVGGGRHLMLGLRDGPQIWRGFAFGRGDALAGLGGTLDIVYSVEMGTRGYGPRLRLVDWQKSTTMGARR
jgi:single-stranded-DNA-specific exonuclease